MDTKDKTRRKPAQPAGKGTGQQKKRPPVREKTPDAPRAKRQSPPRENPQAGVRERTRSDPQKKTAPSPEVVYTQPKPFSRNRFLLRLLTVIAVVLAIFFGMSLFFKVQKVEVSGAEKYTQWQIREASGIRDGENLLGISDARIGGKIIAELPYVKSVRVRIKLPDTVHIEITELEVLYAAEAEDGSWWLLAADGRVVDRTSASVAQEHTQIKGVKITSPQIGEKAAAWQPPAETTPEGETVPVTVYAAERLSAAVSAMGFFEKYGILGEAANVDVSDLSNIQFWYGERYQVKLGDATRLDYKIQSAKAAIDQMDQYQTGVLDASFTIWPDKVGYSAFSGSQQRKY